MLGVDTSKESGGRRRAEQNKRDKGDIFVSVIRRAAAPSLNLVLQLNYRGGDLVTNFMALQASLLRNIFRCFHFTFRDIQRPCLCIFLSGYVPSSWYQLYFFQNNLPQAVPSNLPMDYVPQLQMSPSTLCCVFLAFLSIFPRVKAYNFLICWRRQKPTPFGRGGKQLLPGDNKEDT